MASSDAFVLVAGVLALFAILYFTARNEVVWRAMVCPRSGKPADVELVRRAEGRHRPVRIRACSLLKDPSGGGCEQDCLKEA